MAGELGWDKTRRARKKSRANGSLRRGHMKGRQLSTCLLLLALLSGCGQSQSGSAGACGTAAPKWAQASSAACDAWNEQQGPGAGSDGGQLKPRTPNSTFFKEQDKQRDDYQNNYN